ncbi:MAG: phosphoenolpyruvate--protein phosphotransferase [Pseudomonadota bacterium]
MPLRAQGGGARLLLSRLRALMANQAAAPDRLDRVVALIANTMVADVCSIYVRTEDKSLVLVATEGLKAEAVGRTRLAENEGLVGLIAVSARAKRLTNAPTHPRFSYRPETGEDPYHGFLGVPILRGGRVLGVLVVQNRTERAYDDDEMEALQTVAMVLAELVSADAEARTDIDVRASRPVDLQGRSLNDGLAIGPAHLYDPIVPAARFFATDLDEEETRLNQALDALRRSLDTMLSRETPTLFGESREVLETYRLFAHDPSWEARLVDAVRSGLTAEAAVDRVRREHRARLGSARDVYLRERLHDLEDLENRLLRHLSGDEHAALKPEKGAVLVASRLGPAELLEYRNAGLSAVLLEEGGAGSHAAIVARALGVPAIGGLEGLTGQVEHGDRLIVDGEAAQVHIRPDQELVTNYDARIALSGEQKAEYARLRDLPARTADGIEIDLSINAGLSFDLDHIEETGAAGVGLFRTEFQFMASESLPSLEEQSEFYRSVIERADGKPIVFRTLDLGGDKVAPFMGGDREENPALGWRAMRMALDHPYFFRRQLRALIRAARRGTLRLMFPMVASVEEFDAARALVDAELDWAVKFGREVPDQLLVGAMVETPSLAFSVAALEGKADFLSVGTNDLMQFFFAADRDNARVATRYDLLSGSALSLLSQVRVQAGDAKIPVSVCGEAGGRTLEAAVLIALGYRQLSMHAGRIGPIKRMIRSLDVQRVAPDVHRLMKSGRPDLRNALLNIAKQTGILL